MTNHYKNIIPNPMGMTRGLMPPANCPHCMHSPQEHMIVVEMAMTICKVKGCTCSLVFGYSDRLKEEMK